MWQLHGRILITGFLFVTVTFLSPWIGQADTYGGKGDQLQFLFTEDIRWQKPSKNMYAAETTLGRLRILVQPNPSSTKPSRLPTAEQANDVAGFFLRSFPNFQESS